MSKVLEKVVHQCLTKFPDKNNVLYCGQYGFRKHRSTSDAISDLAGNVVDALDKGMSTIGVFLDMSKAFDSIDHETLFKKNRAVWYKGGYIACNGSKVLFQGNSLLDMGPHKALFLAP